MIIKLETKPQENMTTFVTETIINSLQKVGLEVKVVTKELHVDRDVELIVSEVNTSKENKAFVTNRKKLKLQSTFY